jgi:hypothetical protein
MAKKDEIKKVKFKNQEVSKYDFIICPNCGTEEVGKYCPNCGQSNKDFNKPVKEIAGDLLDSINLDIRLLNTLFPFFTKPGFLAQEYFKGKRKKYVPPMRMYMFVSLVFFFLVQINDKANFSDIAEIANTPIPDSAKHELAVAFNEVDSSLTKSLTDLSLLDKEELRKNVESDSTMGAGLKEIIIGGMNVTENPDIFRDKFLKNISYVLFLLMPFFAFLLALILRRSKKLYVHHLIFSINLHSFIFGFTSLLLVFELIFPKNTFDVFTLLILGIPLYLMFGIRNFYNRSYIRSFFKTIGISILYSFVIAVVLLVIIIVTAQGFYKG